MKRLNTTQPQPTATARRRGGTLVWTAGAIAALGLVGGVLWLTKASNNAESNGPAKGLYREAIQGPLTVSVVEKGKLEALNPVVLTCKVEGRTRLVEILPEGAIVKAGDVVARLDTSSLENERIDLEIRVENARAEAVKERQDLAITKNQAKADIAQAALDLELAQMDLNKYWSGEFPNQLLSAKSEIDLAEAEHKQALDRVEGSEKLAALNYISSTELESDRLREKRAKADYTKATEDLRLLRKYTRIRNLREMLSNIDQQRLTLDRVTRRAEANVIQAEAQLRADDGRYLRESQLLEECLTQLENCVIRAPKDGSVVYAPPRSRRDPPLEAGQEVGENQELVYLPNGNSMMLKISIHETFLDRIRVGQPAQITIDSVPGHVYQGRVAYIASHPDSQQSWLNPDLVVYETHVFFEDAPLGLRSGMTGRSEILIDHFENVVQVPVQSVVARDGQKMVYVYDEKTRSPEPLPVTIGMDNEINVVVHEGLKAGQMVSLVPPLAPGGPKQGGNADRRNWSNTDVSQARDARTESRSETPAPGAPGTGNGQDQARRPGGPRGEGRGNRPGGNGGPRPAANGNTGSGSGSGSGSNGNGTTAPASTQANADGQATGTAAKTDA